MALSIQLNLTNICKSNCLSCRKKTWPQEHMKYEIIESLFHYHTLFDEIKSIFLTGGEPLLYPHLDRILKYSLENFIKVGFLTAGNVKTDWERIVKNPAIKWIRFSIDASDCITYKKLRGIDSFDFVVDNLKELYHIAKKYNRNRNFLRINFTRSKYNQGQENILKNHIFRGYDIPIKTWGIVYRDNMRREKDEVKEVDFKYCNILKNHAIIDFDGKIYPCCYLMYEIDNYNNSKREKFCYGKINEIKSFYEVFNSEKASNIRKVLYDRRLEECKYCYRYKVENEIHQKYLEDNGYFL